MYGLVFVLAQAGTSPMPASTSSCPPDRKAMVVKPTSPSYPESLRNLLIRDAITLVRVRIDETGVLTDAIVEKSSGYQAFDDATLLAARHSVYAPAIFNCVATAGTYIFRAEFRTP
jgi:TonB family protein